MGVQYWPSEYILFISIFIYLFDQYTVFSTYCAVLLCSGRR